MCVIIFVPAGENISDEELKSAWDTNPHGAGYAIRTMKEGKPAVKYSRGFMTFKPFLNAVKRYIGKVDTVLHFRISTSKKINQVQTHPYDPANITNLFGYSNLAVCMNGTITGQTEYRGFNDTMSYIKDHKQAFKLIASSKCSDMLDIVQESTGSKWAIVTPHKVLISSNFKEYNGRYYSNKNHLFPVYTTYKLNYKKPTPRSLLPKKLYKEVCKDKYLYQDILHFIDIWEGVPYILAELERCYTIADIEQTLYDYY